MVEMDVMPLIVLPPAIQETHENGLAYEKQVPIIKTSGQVGLNNLVISN